MSAIKTNTVKQLQYVQNFPVRAYKENDTVKIFNIRDTITIFYLENYVLCKLAPTAEFETNQNIKGTEPYLLYKKGEPTGHYFTSIKDSSSGMIVQLDSFLIRKRLRGEDFKRPSDTAWTLVSKNTDTQKGEVVEKFALLNQDNVHTKYEAVFDSIFYYYSKSMKNVDFSFSKSLDSITKMKLFRIRMIYSERFSQQEQFIIPTREFLFDIKEVLPNNPEIIIKIFSRFKTLANQE